MTTTFVSYENKYEDRIRACALEAWQNTYRHIFPSEDIVQLVNRFYAPDVMRKAEEMIKEGLVNFTVALEGDEVVGYQSSSISYLYAEVTRLYVLPKHIGKGLGTALLNEAEKFFQQNGFKVYHVKVHRENTLGQNFYERKHFVFEAEDTQGHFILKKELAN
jgi:ribosomal protein S18 acetylase RimI-like enzyme